MTFREITQAEAQKLGSLAYFVLIDGKPVWRTNAGTSRPLGEILGATENVGSTTRDKPAPFLPPLFTK